MESENSAIVVGLEADKFRKRVSQTREHVEPELRAECMTRNDGLESQQTN
jgi:hypothetical protein